MNIARLSVLALIVVVAPAAAQRARESDDAARLARVAAIQIARMAESRFDAPLHVRSSIRFESTGPVRSVLPSRTVASESIGTLHVADGRASASIERSRADTLPPGLPSTIYGDFAGLSQIHFVGADDIHILNARFPSPLAENAAGFYQFDSVRATALADGRAAIAVSFLPRSSLHPGFAGRIILTADDTVLSALEMEPAPSSAPAFHTTLTIHQTWNGQRAALRPGKLVVLGTATIRAAAFGIAEPAVSFEIVTVVGGEPGRLEDIERSSATELPGRSGPRFSAAPVIDYNRAGGATLGAAVGISLGSPGADPSLTVSVAPSYSFGLERLMGDAGGRIAVRLAGALDVALRGSAFSQISPTTTGDRMYPRVMNTLVAASLHQDYYDFFRKDGWNAGLDLALAIVRLGLTYEESRQFSIGNNARWSLLTLNSRDFPRNPPIEDGRYRTIAADIGYGEIVPFLSVRPVLGPELRWNVIGLVGSRVDSAADFRSIEGLLSYAIPIAETGYSPVTLTLLGAAGAGTSTLPPQYQFRLRTSAATFGKPGGMVSPTKGMYGGTRYAVVGAELNATDLPWRAMGLPTRNGRGVELILAAASGRYDQEHSGGYRGTDGLWYSEAGIGLGRIPLFITDIVYARVDARMGFGPLGKFGANLTLTAE